MGAVQSEFEPSRGEPLSINLCGASRVAKPPKDVHYAVNPRYGSQEGSPRSKVSNSEGSKKIDYR